MNTPGLIIKLEEEIRTKLLQFENETGLIVNAISMARGGITSGYPLYAIGVTITADHSKKHEDTTGVEG